MIEGGYILKARCIDNSWIAHAAPVVRETWSYLLRKANHKDQKYDGFVVKRGQLFTSYKDIREALHWKVGYRKKMYSEDQMKHGMKLLRTHLMIALTNTPRGVIVTILNYDKYQCPKNYESTNESANECAIDPPSIHRSSLPINKNERIKECKNGNKKPPNPLLPTKDDLQEKIIENNMIESRDKILEFFEYRMSLPSPKRYKTAKGLNSLFRDLNGCRDKGMIISECLDEAMEREWLTPNPEYFKNRQNKKNPSYAMDTSGAEAWLRSKGEIK